MITDLRECFDRDVLHRVYEELYAPVFTDEDERETEEQYAQRLEDPDGEPETHFLVYWKDQEPVGFLIVELYRACSCGLLTFLAVSDKARGEGVAGRLMARAQELLHSRCRLRAIFAECHKPECVDPAKEPIDPWLRLSILSALGAARIPVDYVQPALQPGTSPSRALQLVAFPLYGRQPLSSIDSAALLDFLGCFYKVLGADRDDPDLIEMQRQVHRSSLTSSTIWLRSLSRSDTGPNSRK